MFCAINAKFQSMGSPFNLDHYRNETNAGQIRWVGWNWKVQTIEHYQWFFVQLYQQSENPSGWWSSKTLCVDLNFKKKKKKRKREKKKKGEVWSTTNYSYFSNWHSRYHINCHINFVKNFVKISLHVFIGLTTWRGTKSRAAYSSASGYGPSKISCCCFCSSLLLACLRLCWETKLLSIKKCPKELSKTTFTALKRLKSG